MPAFHTPRTPGQRIHHSTRSPVTREYLLWEETESATSAPASNPKETGPGIGAKRDDGRDRHRRRGACTARGPGKHGRAPLKVIRRAFSHDTGTLAEPHRHRVHHRRPAALHG